MPFWSLHERFARRLIPRLPATPASYFWSASPYVGSSGGAWVVDFYDGYVDGGNRGGSHYVRLVRAGQ